MPGKLTNKEYYELNRERLLAYQKAYHHRTKNTERILRVREYNRQYYLKNKANWNGRVPNRSIELYLSGPNLPLYPYEKNDVGQSVQPPVSFWIDFKYF